jgi:hypothetical protein
MIELQPEQCGKKGETKQREIKQKSEDDRLPAHPL